MNTELFSKDILDTIESQQLAPRPRWMFVIRRSVWWLFASLSVILGGISFGSILFFLREQEWDIFPAIGHGFLAHALHALPIVWTMVFLLFLLLTVYDLRTTERGYRYRLGWLLGIGLFASMLIGVGVYAFGYESDAHELLEQSSPVYRAIVPEPQAAWHAPALGRYNGTIVSVSSTTLFTFKDQDGKDWLIQETSSTKWTLAHRPRIGVRLKIAATIATTPNTLILSEARPWLHRMKETKKLPRTKK